MLWATLKPLAPWATPEIPDVFQPVSRKAAFEALRRGVVAFGPEEGRAKRKAAIWGRLRQALRVLGLHRQPRGCFLAYEPRWRWRDEWRVAHLGACSVGTSLLLVTPEWAVATLTGDDD